VKRPDPRAKKPNAIDRPAVTPEAARADAIQEAIRRVQKKVAAAPAADPEAGAPTRSGQGRRGRVEGGVSDVYKAQVRYKVEQNWAFSGGPSRKGPLRAVVVARIRPDGGIGDVWFEKRSGNTLLDDSAYRAVMKANPLPPLPPGLTDYTIAMVFTPSGVQ
jgi:TonB family protein